jgi:carboxypeptidase Taq
MTYAKLDELGRKLEALEHAQAMLGVDEAVNMPAGGGEKRAEAMAHLAGMHHEMLAAPIVAEWIDGAEQEPLDQMQRAALREFKRVYTNATCLSSDFVRRQVAARVRSEQLWRGLRPNGDWKAFLPAFEGIVETVREEAALRSEALLLSPYDALIEQYDPGGRAAQIAPLFDELKSFLKRFVPEAVAYQTEKLRLRPLKAMRPPYATAKQRALGLELMAAVGFDFNHGRLDISHHPFCGGVPADVRMTTRYTESEFLSSLMGILHETGHGLYEQGLPHDYAHWPVGRARGMAIHESQSLFVEKQIARSAEFWEWAMPRVRHHFGRGAVDGWVLEDLLAHVHQIKPGLIRVDADEATYPLHVIMRFELEQDLVSGALRPRDVPEAWDQKMRSYLGLATIDSPKDGPMQDVHWPSGAFGYFPSYTLGALIAAQLWTALERDHPSARDDMRRGEFGVINQWRRDKIWSQASLWSTPELITRATGEPLNARHFIAHLNRRYLN